MGEFACLRVRGHVFVYTRFNTYTQLSRFINENTTMAHKGSQLNNLRSQLTNLRSQLTNLRSQLTNLRSQLTNLLSQVKDTPNLRGATFAKFGFFRSN